MLDLGELIENFPYVIPRDPASVIKRYIDAHDDEIETFEDKLDEVMDSHQIDNATGDELDEIGKIFGRLGKREGRDDQDYRIYLKTIVQAFNGRGTVPGIISAVAAGLGEPEESIEVTEDYQNLEYDIIIKDWPSHKGSTVEELADLADASVAQLNRTVYKVDEDETGISDSLEITEGQVVGDEMVADDAAFVNDNLITAADTFGLDDSVAVSPDTNNITESIGADDVVNVNNNLQQVADELGAADSADAFERAVNTARWEDNQDSEDETNWDFFEWTEIIDLGTVTVPLEEISADDSVAVNANKTDAGTDEVSADDGFTINANKTTASDQAGVTDAVDVRFNVTQVSDDGGLADAVQSVSTTNVAWEIGSWESMEWAKEHN